MFSNTAIILVNPQMGENIGAAARVMKNFDIDDLRLVKPRDGWPNKKAVAMAAGAADLIEKTKLFNSLSEAIADLEYVYATTAVPRDMNKDYICLNNLNNLYPYDAKVGFVFGRENNGLTNKELSFANQIITINTSSRYGSINLAQAVGLICYELSKLKPHQTITVEQNLLAQAFELELCLNHLFNKLDKTSFFRQREKRNTSELNIRNIFTRIKSLTKSEIKILYGIINALDEHER